jgi:hypothetical protein
VCGCVIIVGEGFIISQECCIDVIAGRREESVGRGLGRPSLMILLPELAVREWVLRWALSRRPLERWREEEERGFRGSTGEYPVILWVDLTSGL